MAREIHDELGQSLTAIKLDLSSLSHDLPAEKKQQSASILKLVDETIQAVRRISTELRPAILDAVGLVAAVEWAAGEFAARAGTKCQLDLPQGECRHRRRARHGTVSYFPGDIDQCSAACERNRGKCAAGRRGRPSDAGSSR